jgi:hypothetical protein
MNYEQRITKIETLVETFRGDNGKVFAAIDDLRKSIAELREHTDQRFTDLRDYVDQRFAEQRDYVDRRIAEQRNYIDQHLAESRIYTDQQIRDLRAHMDANFQEIRRESSVNQRWMIGLLLANTSLIVGAYAKLLGLY